MAKKVKTNYVLEGDCLIKLKELPDNSIDSVVTDPPYELGFMGKSWDSTGIAFNVAVWQECLRVLKPGGHLLAFSGSRTYHRMAVAIEDAGFEIRDQIMWVYGSGFPKSLNIGKKINKYDGWGTALKPAHEPIVMARKPLGMKTVADNVLTYGTGGINIDATRVKFKSDKDRASATPQGKVTSNKSAGAAPDIEDSGRVEIDRPDNSIGRFPANFIHDGSDEVVDLFPDTGGGSYKKSSRKRKGFMLSGSEENIQEANAPDNYGDSGSAARFFYCAKASKKDRNEGLDGLPLTQPVGKDKWTEQDRRRGEGVTRIPAANHHPTVKPTELMKYLITLVTPTNGIVLDPFLGSGSTAKAATLLNINWIGCELTPEYIPIINARVAQAKKDYKAAKKKATSD